jgi:hypothetical protein
MSNSMYRGRASAAPVRFPRARRQLLLPADLIVAAHPVMIAQRRNVPPRALDARTLGASAVTTYPISRTLRRLSDNN